MRIADDTPVACGRDRPARFGWIGLLAVAVIAAAVFLAMPEIDLAVARAFYARETGFVGQHLSWVSPLRDVFRGFYFATIALCLAGLALTWRKRPQWLRLGKMHWLFLAACLAAGPGLVANLILKDQWGRARPKQVADFGGTKTFTPALLIANQCRRNCSFISGEAASTFVIPYAAAVLVPQWSLALVIAGTLGGLAAGLVRMSQGAHFLSDVVFAGVFMALTVLVLAKLMLRDGRRRDATPPGQHRV
jgi:lipid A 4'-phosphatase